MVESTSRTKSFARTLRRRQTDAEQRMWMLLRDRRFDGVKFRRQVPIGPYIADFACFEARLIVELDGSQHAGSRRDAVRDKWLAEDGYRVLRFWNGDVFLHRNAVLEMIWHHLQIQPDPSSVPAAPGHLLPRGEKGDPTEGSQ
jgi:very-short-patch-repair endonuclease